MANPYDTGKSLAQQNKPLPPQGDMAAKPYKELVGGYQNNKK